MSATTFIYPATLTPDEDGRLVVSFKDLPEALTDGATAAEALEEAADCLSEALMGRIVNKQPIPAPSRLRGSHYPVAPDPTVALKAALHSALLEGRTSVAELARRLGIDHKEARRLLDPGHNSKLPRLTDALKAMGQNVAITVSDRR